MTMGFIIKASCDSFANIRSMALREGYEELVIDLAEAFDLIPASVTCFSLHNGTKLMVHLGSQGDLDVVLAEATEWGSHVISVQCSGIPARRSLDALGCLSGVAATCSQIGYLYWMVTESGAAFYRELAMWTIMIFTLLVNLGGFAYLFDDETDKNHPFRLWTRPLWRRLLMLVLSPFTGDVLPLMGSKVCGLDAPIRAFTRDGVVKWGVVMMVVQDGGVLWIMQAMHTGEGAVPLAPMALACLCVTGVALLVNVPRRVSHFVLGSCEAAFREKEELADDAKISMYAAQKIAFKSGGNSPPRTKSPETPGKRGVPPAATVDGQRVTPPPSASVGSRAAIPPSKPRTTAGEVNPAAAANKKAMVHKAMY